MDAGKILVAIGDGSLARVLTFWLTEALPSRIVLRSGAAEASPGDTVVATPGDLLPAAAADLVARGSRAVVLAPVPRPQERVRYEAAGADYVVMSVDNAGLLNAVRDGTGDHSFTTELRTASNHCLSSNC